LPCNNKVRHLAAAIRVGVQADVAQFEGRKSAATRSGLAYAQRTTKLGKGYMSGGKLINEPFDFSKKNRLSLTDLHGILRSIVFPGDVGANQRFHLSPSDYDFLHKYMSMFPKESVFPFYDPVDYPDTYVKHFMPGSDKVSKDPGIRIFNKTGTAYGFLIDLSYVVDFTNQVEFILVAAISTMVVGFLWYSPLLFAKAWMREMGYDPNDKARMAEMKKSAGGPTRAYFNHRRLMRVFLANFIFAFLGFRSTPVGSNGQKPGQLPSRRLSSRGRKPVFIYTRAGSFYLE